jgi:hypothetical protein
MELRDVSTGEVCYALTPQHGLDEMAHRTPIFVRGPRLAVLRDVVTQEAVGKFSDCERALLAVPPRRGVLAGSPQPKQPKRLPSRRICSPW